MLGLVAPTLAAAVLAVALSRQERARPHGSVRWWPAAVGAFLCELALFSPPIDSQPWALQLGPAMWLLTRLVLLAVVLRNVKGIAQPATLAAVGLCLNMLVIALNDGYMPQSASAAAEVWGQQTIEHRKQDGRLHNTSSMTEQTKLPWLADVIAQPEWLPKRNVVSIGDMLLSAGLAGWTFQLIRGTKRDQIRNAI